MSCFLKFVPETSIRIPSNRNQNGITYYDIAVSVGPVSWTVQHRYKEFVELNEKLVSEHSIAKDLLPPKKVIGNKSAPFLEQRQRQLELYLQKVLTFLQLAMCREFVEFLDFNRYDIIYLLQDLAQSCYLQCDARTAARPILEPTGNIQKPAHDFRTLDMYAISERLKMPCPATDTVGKCFDFSHVIDFCSRLESLRVRTAIDVLSKCSVGSSNIDPNTLQFDLIAFRSLRELYLDGVSPDNLVDTGNVRETLQRLCVHHTAITQPNQILLCDCVHKQLDQPAEPAKRWSELRELDLSGNALHTIDRSVALLPKLHTLVLDNNQISALSHLSHLPNLNALSVSANRIVDCIDCHLELGNICTLNLSQNQLKSLHGFRKMYSLVTLNVADNQVASVDEVDHVAGLPCLEQLMLTGNPVAMVVDYRAKVLSRFGERGSELMLDNEKADDAETDMALVMAALRQCKVDPLGEQTFIVR